MNTNEQPKKKTLEEQVLSTVSDYTGVEIRETQYLFFPWFIRGKINAIQGDSSSGKSTLLYCVGAHVSSGESIGDAVCETPGNVMFLTMEDDESDILTAFLDAGGVFERLKRIKDRETITRLALSKKGAIDYLKQIIISFDLKFLVLDPIQAFLTGDINQASNTRPQMARLAKIAEETDCCIAFIQHTGKDTTRKALHRGVGSVDIVAAGRSLIHVVDDPENENHRIAYMVKNNTASRQDAQRAILFQIKDHPNSTDLKTGIHHHYHGHAEIIGILPKYNERIHNAKIAKAEAQQREERKLADYDSEPLVLTIRELIKQNSGGLFIRYSDLTNCISDLCDFSPYSQGKGKDSLTQTVDNFRSLLIKQDEIQIDRVENAKKPKPYRWKDHDAAFQDMKSERGITIKKLKQ